MLENLSPNWLFLENGQGFKFIDHVDPAVVWKGFISKDVYNAKYELYILNMSLWFKLWPSLKLLTRT